MNISLIVITLTMLSNGLYKVTTEEVKGYNSLEDCKEDQKQVLLYSALNPKPNVKLASVTCKSVGKI